MEALTALLQTLNTLSPLAVIALLGLVIFMLVKAKNAKMDVDSRLETIQTNHLHELPTMAEDLRSIADTLRRMELSMTENFTYLRAKINGRA